MQSMSLKSYLNKTMERWARNCTYKDGEDRISTFISNQSSRWGESFRNHFTPPPIKNRKKKNPSMNYNGIFCLKESWVLRLQIVMFEELKFLLYKSV